MQPVDIQPILDAALQTLTHSRVEGAEGRYMSQADGNGVADPWSSAAAVNVLYGLNLLPGQTRDREEWVESLQSHQSEESGLFANEHGESLILTAACMSALSCLETRPRHPPHALKDYLDPEAFVSFARELCWCKEPEAAAREFAAMFTCLVLTDEAGRDWTQTFFDWMLQETDDHTGLLRKECLAPIELEGHWTLLPYLCAYQYPLACSLFTHHPVPRPWRLIDTALEVMEYHRDLFFQPRGQRHLPWVICVNRARRLTAHRFEEARQALERFLPAYLQFLYSQIQHHNFQSLVYIQWDVAVLAELQAALPGTLLSRRPLRQILDRHPFL